MDTVKLKATKGQTHVFHDSKIFNVEDGVVEVPEKDVPVFKTLGFEEIPGKAGKPEAAKGGEEEEENEDSNDPRPPHLRAAKKK